MKYGVVSNPSTSRPTSWLMFRFIGPSTSVIAAVAQPALGGPEQRAKTSRVVDRVDEAEVAEPGSASVGVQVIDLRADAADGLSVRVRDERLHVGVAKERMLRTDLVAAVEQQWRYPVRVVRDTASNGTRMKTSRSCFVRTGTISGVKVSFYL